MSTPVLELKEVWKTYATGDVQVHAVRGVSMTVQHGEFVAVMGSSGSGKSTIMNILGCLDRPTRGSYLLDGTDVSLLDANARADVRNQKIGFVFQGFNLLPRTSAAENVELPMMYARTPIHPKEMRKRSLEALDMVGLSHRFDHHPSQLSGGQQQRVAIARALVNTPSLILADEPTGNLDTRTSIEIMEVFQTLNEKGITIIMVTHEPEIARFNKRQVIMRDGVVLSDALVENRLIASEERLKLPAISEIQP